MTAMSIREGRRARTFLCRDDLYGAFEARSAALDCSVDWLLGEAMKRLLGDRTLAPAPAPAPSLSLPHSPPPQPHLSQPPRKLGPPALPAPPLKLGPPLLPPPPPPPRRRATGSFVGPKSVLVEAIALRLGTQRIVIDRDRFVIGRNVREAQFPIRDGGVSRQHAMIERTPNGWVVVDMASTNGVHLNGNKVTRALIRAGDVIEIGSFAIAVERA